MSAAVGTSAPAINDSITKNKPRAYFTFGRFQPPTLGHRVMIEGLARAADTDGADAYVFVSSSQDKKKNPLSVDQKVAWMRKMFADIPVRIIDTTKCGCRTLPAVLGKLADAKYEGIKMFVGSDRGDDFRAFVPREVEIVAVGEVRNETKNTLAGMSGTKMRAAAVAGNVDKVRAGTGLNEANARALMGQIVSGLSGAKGTNKARRGGRRVTRRRNKSQA